MTDDLISFVRARLDETERIARSAVGDQLFDGTGIVVMHTHGGGSRSVTLNSDIACFVARHDPAHVLRLVQAHREILDLHPHRRFAALPDEWPDHWKADVRVAFPGEAEPYVGCEVCDWNSDYEIFEPGWWCETVRALASIYSDHPDFKTEWLP